MATAGTIGLKSGVESDVVLLRRGGPRPNVPKRGVLRTCEALLKRSHQAAMVLREHGRPFPTRFLMRICPRSRPCLAACLLLLASVPLLAAEPVKSDTASHPHRLMYACLNKDVAVFDMDAGHKFVRWIPLNTDPAKLTEPPVKGDRGAANFRGICADPASGKLWVTYNPTDELICLDLATDRVLWRKKYGKHADSQAITPDGRTMYLPCREDGRWHVLDAQTGDELGAIATGGNPHNTEISPDGSRAFMESLAHPVGVHRRRAVARDRREGRPVLVGGAAVLGLGRRQVGLRLRERAARVRGRRRAEGGEGRAGRGRNGRRNPRAQLPKAGSPHGCPSHGVGLRPNNAGHKEVWVVDSGYGLVYAFDADPIPPKQIATIPLYDKPTDRPEPGWVSFSLDGKLAYFPGDAVVDTDAKKVVAHMPTSEKMIEIDFAGGKPVRAAPRMW